MAIHHIILDNGYPIRNWRIQSIIVYYQARIHRVLLKSLVNRLRFSFYRKDGRVNECV